MERPVSTLVGDPERGVVHFTVWDTGIGIPEEQMERMFEPFVQLNTGHSHQYEGTGLGLALVHRLVELHGGSISVDSQVGKGSRFTVSLPWKETSQEFNEATTAEPTEFDVPGTSTIRKALIVEDSRSAADQISRYLSELGAESAIHNRADDAIGVALETQPDLIILDILLPDPTGWDVLSQLRAEPRTKDIPVLITSVIDDKPRGAELGADGYLVKPITRQRFRQALIKIMTADAEESRALLATAGDEPETCGPLIMLAEDNESSINIVSDYLLARGYRLVVARNGEEAIHRVTEEKPDLILMDVHMPVMDGLEAIRCIHADTDSADIPIIALTALAMPGDRERCLEAGADEYISKPASLKFLVKTIEAQLERVQ